MKSTYNGNGNGHHPKRKRGPKPKLDEKTRLVVLTVIRVGGSRRDAARHVGVDTSTLWRAVKADNQFAMEIERAETDCKLWHLKRLHEAKDWRASAFMLERKFYKEFARRDRPEVKMVDTGHEEQRAAIQQIIQDPEAVRLVHDLDVRMAAIQTERNGGGADDGF